MNQGAGVGVQSARCDEADDPRAAAKERARLRRQKLRAMKDDIRKMIAGTMQLLEIEK